MKLLIHSILILSIVSCAHHSAEDSYSTENDGGNNAPPVNMTSTKLLPSQYVNWVESKENGLKKEKVIGDIRYTAQYKPCKYVICEEARTDKLADSTVKKKTNELNGMQYFNLRISLENANCELLKYGISSAAEYKERVNYFSFNMQNDIKLVDGSDTMSCLLFHYERAYDVVPYGTFLLAFPLSKKPNSDRTLIFYDRGFNKGIIKLFFRGLDINNQPQLEVI